MPQVLQRVIAGVIVENTLNIASSDQDQPCPLLPRMHRFKAAKQKDRHRIAHTESSRAISCAAMRFNTQLSQLDCRHDTPGSVCESCICDVQADL